MNTEELLSEWLFSCPKFGQISWPEWAPVIGLLDRLMVKPLPGSAELTVRNFEAEIAAATQGNEQLTWLGSVKR